MKAIASKAELIEALNEAAALEHQFMCQYLYAAFSLKKSPDASCNDAQFEYVRRWAQLIYMTARQEMEHLSVVNSVLTAIGSQPCFGHPDLPNVSRFYRAANLKARNGPFPAEPCEIPFVLEAFSLRAARRFTCMESPPYREIPDAERGDVYRWGYHLPGDDCSSIVPPGTPIPAGAPEVEVGTIQQLYTQIALGIRLLEADLGEKALFSGHRSGQEVVVSEYQVWLDVIDSADRAVAALQLVMQQGEGLNAPPGFDSHFLNYHQMASEYAALLAADPGFNPAKNLPLNPTAAGYTNPAAQSAATLFSYGYVTLLYMLTGYYGLFDPRTFDRSGSYLTATLEYNSFAPMMTMFVRTLSEILTELPASAPDNGVRAAPVFNIPPADLQQLAVAPAPGNFYGQASFYAGRLANIVQGLIRLSQAAGLPPAARDRLGFMVQNIGRLSANFTTINASGIYPGWKPSVPGLPAKDGVSS